MKNILHSVPMLVVVLILCVGYVNGNEPTDWMVVQRCIIEEANGIDYTGSILASGWAGLHSISNNYDTPTIQIFSDWRWVNHGSPISSLRYPQDRFHALSPDGQWLAVIVGNLEMDCPPCWRGQLTTSHILVYAVSQRGRPLLVPHSGVYAFGIRSDAYRTFSIRWLNNDTILLPETGVFTFETSPPQAIMINPFEESESEPSQLAVSLYDTTAFVESPNWQWIITQLDTPTNYSSSWYLIDLTENMATLPIEATDNLDVAWSHASDRLIIVTQQDMRLLSVNAPTYESEVIRQPIDPTYSLPGKTYISWSYDDRYVAYLQDIIEPGNGSTGVLHIVDIEQKLILDTCQLADSFRWSPDSYQIALSADPLAAISENQIGKVSVMDIEQWRISTVASHRGHVVTWVR